MKTMRLFEVALMTAFIIIVGFSCGGSDDDGNDNPKSSKRIVKTISISANSTYEKYYSYDTQGRIVRINGTETTSSGYINYLEKTYQYGDTYITTKEKETTTKKNVGTWEGSHTYTIENGRIVKDYYSQSYNGNGSSIATYYYSYDTNGYISSIFYEGKNGNNNKWLTWTDGNLSKTEENHIDYYYYSYSNVPWIKGFPFYLGLSDTDAFIFAMGYCGKIPKKLPSQIFYQFNQGSQKPIEYYEYTVQDNLVTKVIIVPYIEDNKSSKTETTIIWE